MTREEALSGAGKGWAGLIGPLYDRLKELGGDVIQVKEKFGGLRFYYKLPPTGVDVGKAADFGGMVERAEQESYETCERCGTKEGTSTKSASRFGWIKTFCDPCREQDKKDREAFLNGRKLD